MYERTLKVAFRNVLRNRRRTIVTFLLIMCGSFLIAIFRFMAFGTHQDMIWYAVGLKSGYIEIAANGWPENRSIERAMDVDEKLLENLHSTPGVDVVSPRISGFALVNHANNSKFVSVFGADWQLEKQITTLHTKLIKGVYGTGSSDPEAILGKKLADNLGVTIGSEINIVTSQFDGSVGAAVVKVVGIFKAADVVLDSARIVVPLAVSKELFALDPGPEEQQEAGKNWTRLTSIGLGIKNYRIAQQVMSTLKLKYPLPELAEGELREESENYDPVAYYWDVLNPGVVQLVQLDQISAEMMMAFLLMILAAGVFNNVQMSIQERLREFGILLGLGMRPIQIVIQIFTEISLIIIPALFAGILAGIGLGTYWNTHPIVFTGEMADAYLQMGFQPRLLTIVDTTELWIAVISMLAPALILTLVATRRIFKLKPVEIINTL